MKFIVYRKRSIYFMTIWRLQFQLLICISPPHWTELLKLSWYNSNISHRTDITSSIHSWNNELRLNPAVGHSDCIFKIFFSLTTE